MMMMMMMMMILLTEMGGWGGMTGDYNNRYACMLTSERSVLTFYL